LSASSYNKTDWNYRIINKRPVLVKAKNDRIRKISAIDLPTGSPFPLEPTENFPMESLEVDKGYLATLKIYTSKNAASVKSDFVEFFEVLDVDQSAEDFIKAYWLYPDFIRFELVEIEPLL
jgi:hypothetical protein